MKISEFKTFHEWINYKRFIYQKNGMCSCGDFQGHSLVYCKNCGTEFKSFNPISILDVMKRKLGYKKEDYVIEYFNVLFKSEIEKFHPHLSDWKKEINENS